MISGLGRHSTGKHKGIRREIMFKQLVSCIHTCTKKKLYRQHMIYGLSRMPLVNNNIYLELARRDFNRCQVQHQLEWHGLQRWFTENGLEAFGVTSGDVLRTYFLAAACIFEPSRATERLAWARVSVLTNVISKYLRSDSSGNKIMERFMHGGHEEKTDVSWLNGDAKEEILVRALEQLVDLLAQQAPSVGEGPMYINNLLRCAWIEWMMQQVNNEDDIYGTSVTQAGSGMVHDKQTSLLIVKVIEICAGRISEASSMMNNIDGTWFIQLASSICDTLHHKMLLSQVTPMPDKFFTTFCTEILLI
jgi:ent-copalyl diphosphate synthase